jgi:hypothetical protein
MAQLDAEQTISFHNGNHRNIDLCLSTFYWQSGLVAIVLLIAIVAFFPLALAFGRDSRPTDRRYRRWI